MVTADFDLTIHIESSKEDANKLVEILRKYSNGENNVYFSFMEVEDNDIEDEVEEEFDWDPHIKQHISMKKQLM